MSAPEDASIRAWTAYWRTGRGASCCLDAGQEVGFESLWHEIVDALADGARVLDLAAGNGAVARACAVRARIAGRAIGIDAVDVADVAPVAEGIRFHARTRLEALPFEDRTFDAVLSQFGFEYADEAKAAAEAARVLAAGGRLRLVAHARDGAITRDVSQRLERLRSVLGEAGPVGLVLRLARAAAAGNRQAGDREGTALAAAAALVTNLARGAPADDSAVFYGRAFLAAWRDRHRYPPAELLKSLAAGYDNAQGVAIRQAQMLRVAWSQDDCARVAARFASSGLVVSPVLPVRDDRRDAQIAWRLDARLSGA
jgi:SAM-dependent methyltransferase